MLGVEIDGTVGETEDASPECANICWEIIVDSGEHLKACRPFREL